MCWISCLRKAVTAGLLGFGYIDSRSSDIWLEGTASICREGYADRDSRKMAFTATLSQAIRHLSDQTGRLPQHEPRLCSAEELSLCPLSLSWAKLCSSNSAVDVTDAPTTSGKEGGAGVILKRCKLPLNGAYLQHEECTLLGNGMSSCRLL